MPKTPKMATRQKVLKGIKALQDHKHLKWQQGENAKGSNAINALNGAIGVIVLAIGILFGRRLCVCRRG